MEDGGVMNLHDALLQDFHDTVRKRGQCGEGGTLPGGWARPSAPRLAAGERIGCAGARPAQFGLKGP